MSFPNRKSTWSSWDTLPIVDTTAVVKWSADATKLVRIEADGLTTATTRVITMPDEDITLIDAASTKTLTNTTIDANWTGNSISNIDVADLANGTDWELITWDAAWAPATVAAWTATHVLTSNGAWAAPTFQAAWGGGGSSEEFSVYLSAQYNFTTTSTILPFDTESFDTWANFDTGTYKYTAPSAGKYRFDIWYVINWGTSWDNMTARVYKNAGIVRRWNSNTGWANDQMAVSFIIDLATSDTIHVQARNATSARASIPAAVDQAWFSWYKII